MRVSHDDWLSPPARANPARDDFIIVDSFAGGGGASTGIEQALGRSPDIAINHDGAALAMHQANHGETLHLSQNIWKHDPLDVVGDRPVGLLWASPDCTHHSKAKGGKPVKRNIRDLANAVVMWAERARPLVICLENVEEFVDWGPLMQRDGQEYPDPDRKGENFKRWIRALRRASYKVQWRELRACDYGAPTIRKRLFVIARRDGEPIVWPKPTHGAPSDPDVIAGRKLPYRTAAEIIDWSLPCPSIFDTAAQIKEKFGLRAVRPLAEATMARIARGVKRYVLDAADPFIVPITHRGDSRVHPIDESLRTVTTANGGEFALVAPSIVGVGGRMGQSSPRSVDKPFQTITAKADSVVVAPALVSVAHTSGNPLRHGIVSPLEPCRTVTRANDYAVVAPTLVQTGYGERPGQKPRSLDLNEPLGTVVAGAGKHALAAPHLMTMRNAQKPHNEADKPTHTITAGGAGLSLVLPSLMSYYGQGNGSNDRSAPMDEGLRTVTCENRHAVVSAFLAQQNSNDTGRPADEPVSTVLTKGAHQAVVTAFMAQNNTGVVGHDARKPVSTIVGKGSTQSLIATHMLSLKGSARRDAPMVDPAATVCAGGTHAAMVAAFMIKYYGCGVGSVVNEPCHTTTVKERFGLITVDIAGEPHVVVDIGMRMLTPRELFRAQGFPDSYIIDLQHEGKPLSKAKQIACCGNSVAPPLAKAIVEANCGFLVRQKVAA